MLTSESPYSVDVSWSYLESWIASQERDCVKFELDPDFQRYHVWDDVKRTRYVEFILRGGRSSRALYFNCAGYLGPDDEGPMQLVDGKQRLTAVRRWLRDEVRAFGVFHSDMVGRMGLGGPGFKVHVNNLPRRADVLRWYLELNAGGVAHTPEEIARVQALLDREPLGKNTP